jgi:hypothetical protein
LGVLVRFPFKNLLLFLASFYHRLLKVESDFSNRDNLRYGVEGKYLGKRFNGGVKISHKDKFVEEVSLEMDGKGYLLKRS